MEIYFINHHILISITFVNNYHSSKFPSGGQINYDAWLILDLDLEDLTPMAGYTWTWIWINSVDALHILPALWRVIQLWHLDDLSLKMNNLPG